MKTIALEVVEMSSSEVVSRISVENKSEKQAELVLRGLLRNMNTDEFFVREVEE